MVPNNILWMLGNKGIRGPVQQGPAPVGLGVDQARQTSNMINSPMGRIGAALLPGGAPISMMANIGANSTMAHALGAPVGPVGTARAAGGFGRAMQGGNAMGLTDRDFALRDGGFAPAGGVVTRAHDRMGSPRGEDKASNPRGGGFGPAGGVGGRHW